MLLGAWFVSGVVSDNAVTSVCVLLPPWCVQSQGVYGSEVVASRQEERTRRLQQLYPGTFKSGGATTVLDPFDGRNYVESVSNNTTFVEAHIAARGMRDMLNSQEMKGKRVSDQPFVAASVPVVFEEVERARSREAMQRGMRVMGATGGSRK